jgi:outer membrane murein-binding lipoprotein Lpp
MKAAKLIIIAVLISALILLSGCQSKYVCKDGRIVSDAKECEETIVITEPDVIQINTTETAAEEEKPLAKFEGDYYPINEEKTEKGITLKLLGYYYVKKGADFGKITGIKYTVKNNALIGITPYLKLGMENDAGNTDVRVADVEAEAAVLNPGQEMTAESNVALSFNKLNITKIVELDLYDSPSKGNIIVILEKKITFG